MSEQLIQVNHYDLVESVDAYLGASQALKERTEKDGHSGVLGYQFFVNPVQKTAGMVITYINAAVWMEHHEMAYQWEEMSEFQSKVKLRHFDLFGLLNDEVEAFIAEAQSNSGFVYSHYPQMASGFTRTNM